MLSLLLPGAQGAVRSHRYYLNRCAVLQDSKRWWNGHCQGVSLHCPQSWREVWDVPFFLLQLQGMNRCSLSAHCATSPSSLKFLYLSLSSVEKLGKLTGNRTSEQNERVNLSSWVSLCQISAANAAAFRSSDKDPKDPSWVMSCYVETAFFYSWKFPLNSNSSCFEWQCLYVPIALLRKHDF